MFTIGKEFTFSASHTLDHLPEDHKCRRLHGHNYTVLVEVSTPYLDGETHMVVDFAKLDFVRDWIDTRWDHRHLNDFVEHPTAEVIAETFAHFVTGELHVLMYRRNWGLAVTVHESARTFARYVEMTL